MSKLIFKNTQYVFVGDNRFNIRLYCYEGQNHLFNDIDVVIDEFNIKDVRYTYSTHKESANPNKFIDAIQEALNEFKEDKSIQSLLDWDGKLKYKISL